MSPGSLEELAESLQAPRTADSDDRPHDHREVSRGDGHQMPFRHAFESSQRRLPTHAGVAGPFGEFAALTRQLLAAAALRASARRVDGSLLCRILVCPATLVRRGTLGDVGLACLGNPDPFGMKVYAPNFR